MERSSRPKGLRIGQVYANTAAARAKLKKGDIIPRMNGAGVTSHSGLIGQLSKTKRVKRQPCLFQAEAKQGLCRFDWEVLTAPVLQLRIIPHARVILKVLNQRSLNRKAETIIMTKESGTKKIMNRIKHSIFGRLLAICGRRSVMI